MLSVVVYGRNDAHGYNLHKRAALSLNAIAHVLGAPEDEILFVDYNSPDELPTFCETIADTLTAEAKRRLRVIRVRPAYHAQFANRTQLGVLEPQSRNIAIRRMNPNNRWVLSTNTDMVFAPKRHGDTLSSVCARLSAGFYHLPRFEVPEGFWERADRRDPAMIIAAMQEYGRRYRLDQVVHGAFDNRFEAPGDFQLFLRDDLYAIGGFDERMIWGWHADTNIARRMHLLRERVDSLEDVLAGYHCGHTRQATVLHSGSGVSNSLDRFVRQIASPHWSSDVSGWGADGIEFETIALTENRSRAYLVAMERAVGENAGTVLPSTYADSTYCEEGFEASAVLPHVCDVLYNWRKGTSIFVVGSDTDFIRGVLDFASDAPERLQVSLCADGRSPGLVDASLWEGAPTVPLERGLRDAEIVLIQYPNARTVARDARANLEWFALRAFERLVEIERAKPLRSRRAVLVVNGMHNLMEASLTASLMAPAAPFAGRLRFGRIMNDVGIGAAEVEPVAWASMVAHDLGRLGAFTAADREILLSAVSGDAHWERLALELLAVANHPHGEAAVPGARRAQLDAIAQAARAHIDGLSTRTAKAPVAMGPRVDRANRLCSAADWEEPGWLRCAERYFGKEIYGLGRRSRWVWERVSLIMELEARVPARSGANVLVVADAPDVIAAYLSHRGYKVGYATPEEIMQGDAADWLPTLHSPGLPLPTSLRPLSAVPGDVRFEAVIAPATTLLSDKEKFAAVRERLRPRMTSGAHFGASVMVHLTSREGGGALSYQDWASAHLQDGILAFGGLRADAPIDDRIPLDTVVKFARNDESGGGALGLSFGFTEGAIVTVGQVWARFPQFAEVEQAAGASGPTHFPAPLANAGAGAREPKFDAPDYPAIFAGARRSLLPFVASKQCVRRSPIDAVIWSDTGTVEFSVPVGAFDGSLRLDLAFSEPVKSSEVHVRFYGEDANVPGYVMATEWGVQVLISPPAASDGHVAFKVDRPRVEVLVLAAWCIRRSNDEV